MRRLNVITTTIALLCSLVPGQGAGAASTMALPDCLGVPKVRPATVTFACADANFSAHALHWTGWGEPSATATGLADVNDCTPNCAAGKFASYHIVVIAKGRQSCPGGRSAYLTVTYAWMGRSPFPAETTPTSYRYPCRRS